MTCKVNWIAGCLIFCDLILKFKSILGCFSQSILVLFSFHKKRLKPRFLPAQKENCLVLVSKVQCNYSIVLGNHQCLIHFHQFVFWLFGLFPATNYPSWVCSPLLFVSLWLTFLRCHWNRLFSLGASNCSHAPISFKIQQKSIWFNLTRGLSTSNLT